VGYSINLKVASVTFVRSLEININMKLNAILSSQLAVARLQVPRLVDLEDLTKRSSSKWNAVSVDIRIFGQKNGCVLLQS
jgi:hypothetical protein